jgi:hypothetical protein
MNFGPGHSFEAVPRSLADTMIELFAEKTGP